MISIYKGKEKIVINRIEEKDLPKAIVVGIPKIKPDKYIFDLNNDGLPEFAIVSYQSSQNRYADAKIYTLLKNGEIQFYQKAKYHKDSGKHVLLGCPDCSSLNLEACKACH